jgi:hypothetical protein
MKKHAGKVPVLKQVLEDVQHLSMQQGWSRKLSSRGRSRKNKNSRADDRADAKRGQRPRAQRLRQTMPRPFRVRNQLVNGFLGEELAGQKASLRETQVMILRKKQRCGVPMRRKSAPGRLYAVINP